MKNCLFQAVFFFAGLLSFACQSPPRPAAAPFDSAETLTQISTIDAVLIGAYDGQVSIGELKKSGDFGIGTYHALDGEMIALDGEFYQCKSDGKVYPAADALTTPFASVTFFSADQKVDLPPGTDFPSLENEVDKIIPTANLFYALRLKGTFKRLRTRAPHPQSKPYPPLVEATRDQAEFEFKDIKGTLVGFRSPPFVKGVNLPGYHLHFISEDKKCGGHVLAFELREGTLFLDTTPNLCVILPHEGKEFFSADLSRDRQEELNRAEK